MPGTIVEKGSIVDELEIIEFEIHRKSADGQTIRDFYGINVGRMREVIIVPEKIARSAREHPAIEGVIELRGEVISLVDLTKWLKVFDPHINCSRVLITEFSRLRAGFLVNRVNRIHHVPYEKLSPPAALMRKGERELVTGVARLKDRMIMMLDFEKILSDIDPGCLADTENLPGPQAFNKGGKTNKNVFIIDDSGTMLSILKNTFEKAGCTVTTAQNGSEALVRLKELAAKAEYEKRPITDYVAAISSDVEMPLMDEMLFLAELKGHPVLKEAPVVFFSIMDSRQKIEKLKNMGASACIQKPDLAALMVHINDIV